MFAEARSSHQEFCVPICVLPATISNNVPGTDLSLGSDTSLNVIVEVRTLSPRGRFRRPPQGPAAGGPRGSVSCPRREAEGPWPGGKRGQVHHGVVPTGPQRGAGQAPRGLWPIPAGLWEASGRAGVGQGSRRTAGTPLLWRSCGSKPVLSWGRDLVALRLGQHLPRGVPSAVGRVPPTEGRCPAGATAAAWPSGRPCGPGPASSVRCPLGGGRCSGPGHSAPCPSALVLLAGCGPRSRVGAPWALLAPAARPAPARSSPLACTLPLPAVCASRKGPRLALPSHV